MPTLYIVRGLPGSGKSTFARELQAKTGALFVEPDMFLMSDGEYKYSKRHYSSARWSSAMCLVNAARINADCIFADVLPTVKDVQKLIDTVNRIRTGYKVKVFARHVTPETSKLWNTHNVRHVDIDRFARAWEDWPGEQVNMIWNLEEDLEGTEKC